MIGRTLQLPSTTPTVYIIAILTIQSWHKIILHTFGGDEGVSLFKQFYCSLFGLDVLLGLDVLFGLDALLALVIFVWRPLCVISQCYKFVFRIGVTWEHLERLPKKCEIRGTRSKLNGKNTQIKDGEEKKWKKLKSFHKGSHRNTKKSDTQTNCLLAKFDTENRNTKKSEEELSLITVPCVIVGQILGQLVSR